MKMQGHDEYWMGLALKSAEHALENGEVPIGAVLVHEGELIATGANQPITTQDPTAHAEIVALRQAAEKLGNYRLVNTTLYVTLEPCLMCLGAMMHARVARLVYGALDSRSGAVQQVMYGPLEKSLNHRLVCQGGVLAEACSHLLKSFFEQRR